MEYEVCEILNQLPMSDRALHELQQETKKDSSLQLVLGYTRNGWPSNNTSIQQEVKQYAQVQEELWEFNGLLWKCDRVVVPVVLREEYKRLIHEGHLGIEKC